MKLKEIYRSAKYYSICKSDRVPGLVIDVTCGGIAMYSRIVELTEDEVRVFHRCGHLDDLAYNICKGDEVVLQRELKPLRKDERIEYVEEL